MSAHTKIPLPYSSSSPARAPEPAALPTSAPAAAHPAGSSHLPSERSADGQQQALRTSETRLRLLTSQVPAILWTTDLQLRITSSTGSARTVGAEARQIEGMSLLRL